MANSADIQAIFDNETRFNELAKVSFDAVDTDRSNFIEEAELKAVMASVAGEINMDQPSDNDIRVLLNTLDKDHDGKVNFEEFKLLFRKVLERIASRA